LFCCVLHKQKKLCRSWQAITIGTKGKEASGSNIYGGRISRHGKQRT
jgi:hypothetical protein